MTASHASMRDDFENSVPVVDRTVAAALAGGALGARMTGGGFGGAVVALVPRDAVPGVRAAVAAARPRRGWRSPSCSTYAPRGAPGATEPRRRPRHRREFVAAPTQPNGPLLRLRG